MRVARHLNTHSDKLCGKAIETAKGSHLSLSDTGKNVHDPFKRCI
jgi:hypothetical protein